jgi:protein-arginine kinase activator protein McsA
MGYCDLHKKQCENIVNIIQFKNGKIVELNACVDCLCDYLGSYDFDILNVDHKKIESLVYKNQCPKCKLDEKDLRGKSLLCSYCCSYFKIIKKEDKINLMKDKIAAAIKVEDYESAAIFKKEIENIKNS